MNEAILKNMTVGLLGQPNTGKSTLFNSLTGSKQHVGNWPGKTVEQKSGYVVKEGKKISVVDLPGTYSLSPNSDEEIITRDFIYSGKADAVIVLIDASQLERSMYLLADYAGINIPVIAVLNMVDVAKYNGKEINAVKLSKKLGIKIISTVATKKQGIDNLIDSLQADSEEIGRLEAESLIQNYKDAFGQSFEQLIDLLPSGGAGSYSAQWTAVKLLENDGEIKSIVKNNVSLETYKKIELLMQNNNDGAIKAASCRFNWIQNILDGTVINNNQKKYKRSKFDKIATHSFFGKILAVVMIFLGFAVSMAIAMPFMMGLLGIIPPVNSNISEFLNGIGTYSILISLITEAIIPSVLMAVIMAIFVSGVSLVFGFMEDIGYMARIAYVFDAFMSKIGLHGKAIMPFIVSFGCNMGGISGSRVIDSWQQRVLTIAVSLVIPCGAMWGVTGLIGSLFFGKDVAWILISIFLAVLLHMKFTSWFFGRMIKDVDKTGLIMELPPYHKPNWKTIFSYVWSRMKGVLIKALKIIVGVSVALWILSYSPDGNVESSLIYGIGKMIEPAGLLFGLNWQLFTAFIVSALSKEAVLGVLAMLLNVGGGVTSFTGSMISGAISFNGEALSSAILASVHKAQALAFMFAFFFNVPCMAAIATIRVETCSVKWTLRIVLYYVAVALIFSAIAYRIGLLIF